VAFGNVGRPKKIADAGILADMTYVWEWVWCLLWLALAIAALAVGGRILIRGLALRPDLSSGLMAGAEHQLAPFAP